MLIDAKDFPLVWVEASPSSDSSFEAFEALLAREQTFVLLNKQTADEGQHEHTPEERKRISLWMKRNKAALRSFVKASIYIEPNAAKRLAAKPFAVLYEKFWGFAMFTTASEAQSLALARKLLAQ
ncbi:hypothetical protein POF45_04960 [Pseudomonas sp. 681]|jgi:hypothetical protein|uniref:Uncharacterized protein n=1 Tax=Pseudomonas fungipugnans TaxID=3024217 RepID=A0ABT6QIS2_9PSED|nr:hypothetical protein [Pseudomonas sp. 681]MDI2590787.1 hypothetical protein [Pseudomonas sp. 681]